MDATQRNLNAARLERVLAEAEGVAQRAADIIEGVKVAFSVDAAVTPGQPIPVTWRVSSAPYVHLRAVVAIIYLNKAILYQSRRVRCEPDATRWRDSRPQTVLLPVPAFKAVATRLYKVGERPLRIEVAVFDENNVEDPLPREAEAVLTVTREAVSGDWWQWDATQTAFAWKETYGVSGVLRNPRSSLTYTAALKLFERDSHTGTVVERGQKTSQTIRADGESRVAFAGIKQDWSWLLSNAWTTSGPCSRTYTYEVEGSLDDPFGNNYPFVSSPLTVSVAVSTTKQHLADGARASLALAIGCVIGAVIAPPFAPVAGAAASLTAGAGLAALDPLPPDFEYVNELAEVREHEAREAAADGDVESEPLAPVRVLQDLANRIIATEAALARTEARYRAAVILQERAIADIQRDHFGALQEAAMATAERLLEGVPAAADAIDALVRDADVAPILAAWRRDGMPRWIRDEWEGTGLPWNLLARIDELLRQDRVDRLPLALGDLVTWQARAFFQAAGAMAEQALSAPGGWEDSDTLVLATIGSDDVDVGDIAAETTHDFDEAAAPADDASAEESESNDASTG